MPDWLAAIFLGVVEGLTEFIPVSSTGHLIIVEELIHPSRQLQTELFNVVIQCGAVLAVLLVFTRRFQEMVRQRQNPATRAYVGKLLLAFFVTGSGGLLLKEMGLKLTENALMVATTTFIGGVLILVIEWWLRDKTPREDITWSIALAVGLAQLLAATFPGTSRSGATILVALALGLRRPLATEFSFLLGIPTLLAAGAYQIIDSFRDGTAATENWPMIGLASVAATITAFIVVKWLLRFVQSHTFVGFGWYRIVLGAVIIMTMLQRPD